MIERTIKNLNELQDFAGGFLEVLVPNKEGATVVGLSGELGSGKTAFVKVLAKVLGVEEEVLSPTFVIAKFYPIPKDPRWKTLVHADLYRIDDPEELKALRFKDVLSDAKNLVVIEWPERADIAPALRFQFVDETTRIVSRG